jgi:hypothetical protein
MMALAGLIQIGFETGNQVGQQLRDSRWLTSA